MSNINQKLTQIIAHAYQNSPAFTARMKANNLQPSDIQTVADLEKLPIITKDEVIAHQQQNPPFGDMLGVPLSDITTIFMSPGPIYEPNRPVDEDAWQVTKALLTKAGFSAEDTILNTLSYHFVPAGSLFETAFTRLGATVVPSGFGNTDLQIKLMSDLGITGYVGTASFLIHLIRRAEEMGFDFKKNFKLKRALVTAEPLPSELRQTLQSYGITVCNTYATAELGVLAYSYKDGLALDLVSQPIIQVVNPETGQQLIGGETGEIVVTNFNHIYPLIRFGTGDLAINLDPNVGHSEQSERQIIIVGRVGDAVKVRGMFVHPTQLNFALVQVFGAMGIEIDVAAQGIVSRPDLRDELTVRIAVPEAHRQEALKDALKLAVQQACRVRADKIEFVDAIDPDARGMVDQRSWD